MTILIKNGRLINPSENLDKVMDIFVEDGIIKEKAESIEKQADTVIDAAGCYVSLGINLFARTFQRSGTYIQRRY